MTAPANNRSLARRAGFTLIALFGAVLAVLAAGAHPARADLVDMPVVKLQSLDKITARTMIFEARVGNTVKFGPLYIKIRACRKAPPIEQPEAAAFLQVWEVTPQEEAKWVFSGWMYASSPGLSAMNHPVYDVWVIDCLERKSTDPVPEEGTPPPAADQGGVKTEPKDEPLTDENPLD